jgi:hypothetical protein
MAAIDRPCMCILLPPETSIYGAWHAFCIFCTRKKRIENSFDLKMKTHMHSGRLRDLFFDWVADLTKNSWGVAKPFWRGRAFWDHTSLGKLL